MQMTYFSSNEEILAELGGRIKAARIAASVTQKELADKTNLSQRTISNLEAGRDVSFSTVIEVMRFLGMLQNIEMLFPAQRLRPNQLAELGKMRERVRKKPQSVAGPQSGWRWGDES